MNLSQIAVKRPIAVSVGVIVVLIFGFLSLNNLGLDLFPDLQFPYITVATVYPAADPQTVEEEVTRPVEDMLSTISGLRRVQSTSMENMSVVTAEFGWSTSISQTLEDIRGHLSALALTLPPDVHPPFVTPIDPGQLPVMIIGLTSSEGAEHTTARTNQVIRPALEQIPGVGQVSVLGGVQREIQVLYRSEKLDEHELTPAMLEQLLSLQNALVPAGIIEDNGIRMHARVGNHFADVQEIRDLVIGESQLPVQGIAALWPPLLQVKDVADVIEGLKANAGSARIDGEHTVLLHVLKRPGANTVQVAQGLKRAIEDLGQTVPDMNISIITDQSMQIVSSLNNLVLFGTFGALLAVGVLFLFLRTWRGILVIATAIPLSIVVTVAFLYFTDVSLNLMTLGGLSLGIGMLVDNAIIVLESIFRHRSRGATPEDAAINGAKEVSGAVIAATVTTVVVFLPVLFMETFAARLFRELGLTVSLSLFASLIVSLTVVPAMAGSLLRREAEGDVALKKPTPAGANDGLREAAATAEEEQPLAGRLGDSYERALSWALDRKAFVLVTVVAIIGLTTLLWPRLGLQFLPDSPSRSIYISMETAPGTPLAQSEAVAEEAERRLQQLDLFRFITMQVGEQHQDDLISILSDHGPTSIKMIGVSEAPLYGRRMEQAMKAIRNTLADLPVEYTSVSNAWDTDANLFSSDVVLRLFGNRYDDLESTALRLQTLLKDHPAVAEVRATLAHQQPEIFLAVDQSRALIGGLTTGQISLAVRHALTGVQATQVRQNGQTIPVMLRPHPNELTSLDELLNFRVSSPVVTGLDDGSVRLGNVVEAQETTSPQTIRRVDGARVVDVKIKPADADLRHVNEAIAAALEKVQLPPGVTVQQAGVTEQIEESLGELAFSIVFALALVYLVMVAQFESWRNPLIILTTAPLAAVGVLWALWLSNTSVSVIPLLGVIILGGIVVNNGILLVDYMGNLQQQGMDVRRAVLVGARTRLRPVLMTATTTVGGMLPLAISQGEGMEMQGPLAITVIGGLVVATVMTLFVVPTLFAAFHEGGSRRQHRSGPARPAAPLPMLWIVAGVLSAHALLGATPAGAQSGALPQTSLSRPTLAVGVGYDVADATVTYMGGAGWRASVGDVDWTVFAGGAGNQAKPTTWVLSARGNWFQPISFAGYYELEGELFLRQRAKNRPATAFSLTGDAVLGNITLLVEYDHISPDFPSLPWDGPGRWPSMLQSPGMRRLRAELTQQPLRELNLVREFEWARRFDDVGNPGALLVRTGAELRSGRNWLTGKVGLRAAADHWSPAAQVGLRLRPGNNSSLEIRLASTTVWAESPILSAVYDVTAAQRVYNFRLDIQPDENNVLLPSIVLQGSPRRSGWRWQLALDTGDKAQSTSFGIFTNF